MMEILLVIGVIVLGLAFLFFPRNTEKIIEKYENQKNDRERSIINAHNRGLQTISNKQENEN